MTSRISGSSGYSGIYEDASDHGSDGSESRRSGASSRPSPSASWYAAESLSSFQSSRQARSERSKADDDLKSLFSYVSWAVSDEPGGYERPEDIRSDNRSEHESPKKADDDHGSLASFASYLFSEHDDTPSYMGTSSHRGATDDAGSTRSRGSGSGETLWGVDKSEYEAVQRDEGMPDLEEEPTRSDTASILSQDTFYDARSRLSDRSGSSSKASSSDASSSSRRLRAFSRLRLTDEVKSLIGNQSNASGTTQSRSSRRPQGSVQSTNSRNASSIASKRSDGTRWSRATPAERLSMAQERSRWIPPGSRAPNLSTIEDFAEGDELSRLEDTLSTMREAAERRGQRVIVGASEVASSLQQEVAYQDRRAEILSARTQRQNSLPSLSSGSFSTTDSEVIARVRRETSLRRGGDNASTSSRGAAIGKSWAMFDDTNRRER